MWFSKPAGAQQEADQWPGFLLLLKLMATASLHIHFIGPEVPKTMNEDYHSLRCPVQQPCKDSSDTAPLTARSQAKSEDATHEHCMQLSFHQGLYHDVQEELVVKHGKADLVFGGNAGGVQTAQHLPCLLHVETCLLVIHLHRCCCVLALCLPQLAHLHFLCTYTKNGMGHSLPLWLSAGSAFVESRQGSRNNGLSS